MFCSTFTARTETPDTELPFVLLITPFTTNVDVEPAAATENESVAEESVTCATVLVELS
ncbi:hypothetical protein MCHI_003570 [Candidatus Magnetoovum chiemensis]|nr:hypothetical protein MCHI_003570 [Candidatus Magnetoovum chiemensis]